MQWGLPPCMAFDCYPSYRIVVDAMGLAPCMASDCYQKHDLYQDRCRCDGACPMYGCGLIQPACFRSRFEVYAMGLAPCMASNWNKVIMHHIS